MTNNPKATIQEGKAILGIEFGSTRIKAVLIDENNIPIAQGSHEWENQLIDGLWTYSIEAIWNGVQNCYADLRANVISKYDVEIEQLAAIGVSAMMHGYMAFNEKQEILAPFRTWRNTNTAEAAAKLSELFHFNIPLRWSISHLYQAILNKEDHVNDINFLTTLAGYIHWQITGKRVLGVGDASGMLPIDSKTKNYDAEMIRKFDELVSPYGFDWKITDILPQVLSAGEDAGTLTAEGAKRLDISGHLKPGTPVCPPEGDAGTGMVATNAVRKRTGNVSAGTSSFSMIVLEKALSRPYEMIDMVTTPDGSPVAMVHCNNCTSDLNAWVNLFKEYQELLGIPVDMNEVFGKLYNHALKGDADCGGLHQKRDGGGEAEVSGGGVPGHARRWQGQVVRHCLYGICHGRSRPCACRPYEGGFWRSGCRRPHLCGLHHHLGPWHPCHSSCGRQGDGGELPLGVALGERLLQAHHGS